MGDYNPGKIAETWQTTVAELDLYFRMEVPRPTAHTRSMCILSERKTIICTKCLKQRTKSAECPGMLEPPTRETLRWWV